MVEILREVKINGRKLKLARGDITELKVDAIVNAANERLKLGGGVAGAILRKGGREIQEECDKIGYCPVGEAVVTKAGKLEAKYVIHAVGPRYGEGGEDDKLKNATLNSLRRADERDIKSIAFPAISAGTFGFPKDRCAEIMLKTIIEYLRGNTNLEEVIVCLYDNDTYKIFERKLADLLGSYM
ncbi:MAG: macro domain-containing protein [Candidatus Nezhaarchaeales archaeon]